MNYKEVITLAVDAFAADGNAFVTEYAGASDIVSQFGLYDPAWDPKAFSQLEPVAVVDTLTQPEPHQLLRGRRDHLPVQPPAAAGRPAQVPAGPGRPVRPMSSTAACQLLRRSDRPDGVGRRRLRRRLRTAPHRPRPARRRAPDQVAYLTRMYTTISPDEMMEDPIFRPTASCPRSPNQLQATRLVRCDGHADWTLPDGRKVFVPNNGPWPDFVDELPYEEEVQTTSDQGRPDDPRQQHRAINKALDAWNNKMDPVEGQLPPGADEPGDDPDEDPGHTTDSNSNCSCDARAGAGSIAASLGLLGLLALRPRRRR
jgi:hypothetical protein